MINEFFRSFRWLKPHLKLLRQFVQDYGLPLIATVLLLILVILGVYIRDSQHVSIAAILDSLDSKDGGYGQLLSNDKTGNLTVDKSGNTYPNQSSGSSSNSTPGSFSVNTNTKTTGSGSTIDTGNTQPSFTATIASFEQGSVALECSKPKPKARWCTKLYTFSSGIRSRNGPGVVGYGWRSTIASATQNSSVPVGNGTTLTPLQKTISLQCDEPSSFTLQFVILSPQLTQSTVKTINHNCNEI